MGEALLKHSKASSNAGEPWRHQLLNAAISVGCSLIGAAAAVFIIRNVQAGGGGDGAGEWGMGGRGGGGAEAHAALAGIAADLVASGDVVHA
jgi:hypothetical protein